MKNNISYQEALKILAVSSSDNIEVIQKAYRKKASEYHPDKNPGRKDLEEKMKEINQAYEILKTKLSQTKNNQNQGSSDYGSWRDEQWHKGYKEYQEKKSRSYNYWDEKQNERVSNIDDLVDFLRNNDGPSWRSRYTFAEFNISPKDVPPPGVEKIFSKQVNIEFDCHKCGGLGCDHCRYFGNIIYGGTVRVKITTGTKSGKCTAYTERNQEVYVLVRMPETNRRDETTSNLYWKFGGKQKKSLTVEIPIPYSEAKPGNKITIVLPEGKLQYELKQGELIGKEILVKYTVKSGNKNISKKAKMRIFIEIPDQQGKYPKSEHYKKWLAT